LRKLGKALFIISSAFSFLITACGGSAIGDAQEFSPNEPPSIISIKAVNFDGSEITQLDIEPYKQFKLIVEAVDPDNNPLEYKFDSESGTFAGIISNPKGCTAVFKTGSIKGGQNIELWAGVSDGNGAIVRQSYNLGTGKLGPTIVASFEKIRFRPVDKIKLSVCANCSGFFQLYCNGNGNGNEKFDFEKDMYRYSYSPNKTTDFMLAGPNCTSHADIVLEAKPGCVSDTDYVSEEYNLVLIFRDGLFQTSKFIQTIYVDGTPPAINSFSPNGPGASTDPEVIITFNEDIGYADSSSLKLNPADGTIKLKSMSGKTAVFSVSGLKTLTDYTATVKGVSDIAGNTMDPAATYTFKTISGDLKIKDNSGGNEYTAYCGFNDKIINLTPTFKGAPVSNVNYTSSDSGKVSVDSTGQVTIKTINLDSIDQKVEIKAQIDDETALYTVTINSWYLVTKVNEFGQGGIIDQNLNGRFRLAIDEINFNGATITPIGKNGSFPFTGVFDGDNKILKNFSIQATASYTGLFAYNTGTIQNLTIDSASIETNACNYIGILCGYSKGKKEGSEYVEGIIRSCHVIKTTVNGKDYIGGIAGCSSGVIEDCSITESSVTAAACLNGKTGGIVGHNYGDVTLSKNIDTEVNGLQSVGGLIGYASKSTNEFTISGCSSNGEVTGTENVGGLIGLLANGNIDDCHSTGNVVADSANYVGGLVGYCKSGTVKNSYHTTGSVKGSQSVGGLIGQDIGSDTKRNVIKDCYSSGDVNGQTNVGGLIGDSRYSDIKVESGNTYSSCNVFGDTSFGSAVGGLIGYCNGTNIAGNSGNKIYTEGTVEGHTNVGGLIGQIYSWGTVTGCYHQDGIVQGTTFVGGLIGYISTGPGSEVKISGSYAKFNLDNNSDVKAVSNAGGLIGRIYDNTQNNIGVYVSQCYACVDIITVTNDDIYRYIGGLIGSCYYASAPGKDIITECFSAGNIVAHDNVGGLIGIMTNCRISDCYSKSNVDSFSIGGNGGGLVGNMTSESKISKCYAAGDVLNGNGSTHGGLVGVNDSNMPDPIISSFWKKDKIGGGTNPNNGFGTPKLSSDMITNMPYLNGLWDISFVNGTATIWKIDSGINGGYPYLKNNPPPPQ